MGIKKIVNKMIKSHFKIYKNVYVKRTGKSDIN